MKKMSESMDTKVLRWAGIGMAIFLFGSLMTMAAGPRAATVAASPAVTGTASRGG